MEKLKVTVKVVDEGQGIVQMNNVRMTFKCLWKPNIYQGKPSGRQVATFEFSQDEVEEYKKLITFTTSVLKRVDSNITSPKDAVNDRFRPYIDKDGKKHLVFRTSNSEKYPSVYVDENGRVVYNPDPEIEDRVFYPGCRVNVKVQLKAEMRNRGVELWSNLQAIQFAADDERIGGMSEKQLSDGFAPVQRELPSPQTMKSETGSSVSIDDLMG